LLPDFSEFRHHHVADRKPVERRHLVRRAHYHLQILADCRGEPTRLPCPPTMLWLNRHHPSALNRRMIENPLNLSPRSGYVVEWAYRPIEPEMHARYRRHVKTLETIERGNPLAHHLGD